MKEVEKAGCEVADHPWWDSGAGSLVASDFSPTTNTNIKVVDHLRPLIKWGLNVHMESVK